MHNTYSCDYWYFQGAFNDEQCDTLLSLKKQYDFKKALINNENEDVEPDINHRKTEVFFSSEQFVYNMMQPWLEEANKNANWNMIIDSYEPFQFTHYEDGGHYDWHTDAMSIQNQAKVYPHHTDKIRKLSASIILSDSDNYEGGDLQFIDSTSIDPNGKIEKRILTEPNFRTKGSIVIFPSHIWHRVTPVTSGFRNSIVIWYLGPLFR